MSPDTAYVQGQEGKLFSGFFSNGTIPSARLEFQTGAAYSITERKKDL